MLCSSTDILNMFHANKDHPFYFHTTALIHLREIFRKIWRHTQNSIQIIIEKIWHHTYIHHTNITSYLCILYFGTFNIWYAFTKVKSCFLVYASGELMEYTWHILNGFSQHTSSFEKKENTEANASSLQ